MQIIHRFTYLLATSREEGSSVSGQNDGNDGSASVFLRLGNKAVEVGTSFRVESEAVQAQGQVGISLGEGVQVERGSNHAHRSDGEGVGSVEEAVDGDLDAPLFQKVGQQAVLSDSDVPQNSVNNELQLGGDAGHVSLSRDSRAVNNGGQLLAAGTVGRGGSERGGGLLFLRGQSGIFLDSFSVDGRGEEEGTSSEEAGE